MPDNQGSGRRQSARHTPQRHDHEQTPASVKAAIIGQ